MKKIYKKYSTSIILFLGLSITGGLLNLLSYLVTKDPKHPALDWHYVWLMCAGTFILVHVPILIIRSWTTGTITFKNVYLWSIGEEL